MAVRSQTAALFISKPDDNIVNLGGMKHFATVWFF